MSGVRHKSVYLSGPMTGLPDHNRAAFKGAQDALHALGARFVFNPNESVRGQDGSVRGWMTREEAMRRDLHKLTEPGLFDVVVTLDGVEGSEGALVEIAVAEQCGIEVTRLATLVGDR